MMEDRIIVIDDEKVFLDTIKRGLVISGFKQITTEYDPESAAVLFKNGEVFDIAMIDVSMPGINGIELLHIIKENSPDTECIMVSALDQAKLAVDCMNKGAYDYLVKPVSREDLLLTLNRALERKRFLSLLEIRKGRSLETLKNPQVFSSIITQSPNILKVLREAELHARSNVPILITGESGTGKELLARAIHQASSRSAFKFSAINMASMSSTLFDSEFFGHTSNAFTGAQKERKGYLQTTEKGTLFLDEIGDLPMDLQGKLLRVLQDGEYFKLGQDASQKADIRFIAATNADLDRLMAKGKFRKDLYYRLKGTSLFLPPLKERKKDIRLLIQHFLSLQGEPSPEIDTQAVSILTSHDYPGNIRELKSIILSALNLSQGKTITPKHLPLNLKKNNHIERRHTATEISFQELSQVEKKHIINVYQHAELNKSKTAKLLGIGLNTLRRKLESYCID